MGLVVVGRGRLGRSLAGALGARLVPGREPLAAGPEALVMLAVPDAAIPEAAARIAGQRPAAGRAYVHLSGALGLDALEPLRAAGFAVGSLHPLQAFPSARPPEVFNGVTFAVDASDEELLAELEQLARRLGGMPRRVRDQERALYHASATLAGNLVALAAEAGAGLGALGWTREDAVAALLPLMRGAVDNLAEAGLPWALSGPVRRGDAGTVRRHLSALHGAGDRRLVPLYRILSLAALDLAAEAGLQAESAAELRAALGESSTR